MADDCCTGLSPSAITSRICSCRMFLFLLSAIPAAIIFSLEQSTLSISYTSDHWFHDCTKWDPPDDRFLVSTMTGGGLAEVKLGGEEVEERVLLKDKEVKGNMSLGIFIDRFRNRALVVYADVIGYRYGGLGAYRLDTWDRLFLTHLNRPGDEPLLADDVAVDEEGNSYITDAKSNKIWKVNPHGEILSIIKSKTNVQK